MNLKETKKHKQRKTKWAMTTTKWQRSIKNSKLLKFSATLLYLDPPACRCGVWLSPLEFSVITVDTYTNFLKKIWKAYSLILDWFIKVYLNTYHDWIQRWMITWTSHYHHNLSNSKEFLASTWLRWVKLHIYNLMNSRDSDDEDMKCCSFYS